MNAFEQVVARVLVDAGYWVRPSYKVSLTREDKDSIGRPTCPRWEIDLLAYQAESNLLLAVECKSYLDSGGIAIACFNGTNPKFASRFKAFNDKPLRGVLEQRLIEQLIAARSCRPQPKIRWALAAGKFKSIADKTQVQEHFTRMGWELFDADWIGDRLRKIAADGYENDMTSIVAKLLRVRANG